MASDYVVYDSRELLLGQTQVYSGREPVAKWIHHIAIADKFPAHTATVTPVDHADGQMSIVVRLLNAFGGSAAPDQEEAKGIVSWYRFGLSSLAAVPSWRQSLFAASTLVASNPAAAVVLVAAGFEAFFTEFMRIKWRERDLHARSFETMSRQVQSIASRVSWLPAAVGIAPLSDAPDNLYDRWQRAINKRRNDVVHRADVHVTSAEAHESIRVVIDAISFFDPYAFVRPHAFFVGQKPDETTSADA